MNDPASQPRRRPLEPAHRGHRMSSARRSITKWTTTYPVLDDAERAELVELLLHGPRP